MSNHNEQNLPAGFNPYVGPRPFEENDEFFYGRDQEADDLLSLVISEPLVLFSAESGAGKSSLINKRLVPDLRERGFFVYKIGRVNGTLSKKIDSNEIPNIYIFNLFLSLIDKKEVASQDLLNLHLVDFLASDPIQLVEHSGDQSDVNKVLIIDQFEEILTTNTIYWRQREDFFRQLNDALTRDSNLWVVLVIREDRATALDPYIRFFSGKLNARFYMERMQEQSALLAIKNPAIKVQRPYAPLVAERLVNNLRIIHSSVSAEPQIGQYIEPVQLQVICYQLWEKLRDGAPGNEITQEDIEEYLGDINKALSDFYERVIDEVIKKTGVTELTVRQWFNQKIIIEGKYRGIVHQGITDTERLDNHVVIELANHYLLRSKMRAGDIWYELNHDRFIEPIIQANQKWLEQQPEEFKAASKWDTAGRPRKLLYKDERLGQAELIIKNAEPDPLLLDFLEASQKAQKKADADQADKIASEREKEAQAKAETRKKILLLVVVSVFSLIIGLLFLWIASNLGEQAQTNTTAAETASAKELVNRSTAEAASTHAIQQRNVSLVAEGTAVAFEGTRGAASELAEEQEFIAEAESTRAIAEQEKAQTEEDNARSQHATAEAARAEANSQKATAEAASANTERAKLLELAQVLAFNALSIARNSNNDELAVLLALEADKINKSQAGNLQKDIERSITPILSSPYFSSLLKGHSGSVVEIAFSTDTNNLISVSQDGTLRIWDLTQPGTPSTAFTFTNEIPEIDFYSLSRDGSTLALATREGEIHIWKIDTAHKQAEHVHTLYETYPNAPYLTIQAIALSPDGSKLATSTRLYASGPAATAQLWNLSATTPTMKRANGNNPSGYDFLTFSPNGDSVFSGNTSGDNHYFAWNVGSFQISRREIFNDPRPDSFSQLNGEIYQLATNQRNILTALILSPDGKTWASANEDGKINLWVAHGVNSVSALLQKGCTLVTRNLTEEEWMQYIPGETYRETCDLD